MAKHVLQEPGCLHPSVSSVQFLNACEVVEPPDDLKDLIGFAFNNLSSSNLFHMVTEFSDSVAFALVLF